MSGFVIALWEQRGGAHAWLAVGACCASSSIPGHKMQEKAAPLSLATKNRPFASVFCYISAQEHVKALIAGPGCAKPAAEPPGPPRPSPAGLWFSVTGFSPGFSPAPQQQVVERVSEDSESTTCSRSQLGKRSKLSPPELGDWEGSGCSDKYLHLGIFSSRSSAGKTPHCPCSEPDLFNYSECNTKWL